MRRRLASLSLSLSLFFVSQGSGVTVAAEEAPPLPGPGYDIPVDLDGDGLSTYYGDRYGFNHWLASGGSLEEALLSAELDGAVIDLSAFFSSPEAALSPDALLATAGGSSSTGGGGAAAGGGGNSHIDFTRRIPPDIAPDAFSEHIRVTPDGQFYVFSSAADLGFGSNNRLQIYRVQVDARDVSTIDLVSRDDTNNPPLAAENCEHPSISDDGLVIAFDTTAQLEPSRDSNTHRDVYVADFRGGVQEPVIRLISGESGGSGPAADDESRFPAVSGDGTVVVFTSKASNLIKGDPGAGCAFSPCVDNVYRVGSDHTGTAMERVSVDDTGVACAEDCRTFDEQLGTGGDVVNSDGTLIVFQGAPDDWTLSASADCDQVVVTNQQVYLRDLTDPASKETFVVSADDNAGLLECGDGDSRRPSISGDGSRIVFSSLASNLIDSDGNSAEDVFFVNVLDLPPGGNDPVRASVDSDENEADGPSRLPMLTVDGQHVVFSSAATNLAEDPDTEMQRDIFVRHLDAGRTRRMNMDCEDEEANGPSTNPDVFLDGRAVVYQSAASNLLDPEQDESNPTDNNGVQDVFESRLQPRFIRGDANQDGGINQSDSIFIWNWLFSGGDRPVCMDAADVNDDGNIDNTDPTALQNHLFGGGPPPPCPFGGTSPMEEDCDFDPTEDCLSCKQPPDYCAGAQGHDHGGESGCP